MSNNGTSSESTDDSSAPAASLPRTAIPRALDPERSRAIAIAPVRRSLPDSGDSHPPFHQDPSTSPAAAANPPGVPAIPSWRAASPLRGWPRSCLAPYKQYQHCRSLSFLAGEGDLTSPGFDQPPADGEAESASGGARRKMWLEDSGQHSRGNPRAIVDGFDHHSSLFLVQDYVDPTFASQSRILENVE